MRNKVKKLSPLVGVTLVATSILLPSFMVWLICAPSEEPVRSAELVAVFFSIYSLAIIVSGRFFSYYNLGLHRSIFTDMIGGLTFVFSPFFGGGAAYLVINHAMIASIVLILYLPAIAILARMKYLENNIDGLIVLATKRRSYHLHEFNFTLDGLPLFISEKWRKYIFNIAMFPILTSAAIALSFSRSDYKYEISSPFGGVVMLGMICITVYGNLVNFFYWIHYLRNREKYSQYENWPREQFINQKEG